MKTEPKSYGMFTSAGDSVVGDLVVLAKAYQLPSKTVLAMMESLAKDERYGEITDTEVRECVGMELGWYK